MMTIEKCKKLLAERVAHAKQAGTNPDGTLMDYHKGLYLLAGDLVWGSGWTQRELAVAPLGTGTKDARLNAIYAHWFPLWEDQTRERDKARRQKKFEADHAAAMQRWERYGPPPRYAEKRIEDLDIESETQSALFDKVLNFPYRSEDDCGAPLSMLAILGPPGTRKTQLASGWLRERMVEHLEDGQFISAEQLSFDAKSSELVERYMTVPALVIDDIGVSAKDVDSVLRVVDARINNQLATVFTSNASPTELKEKFGPRGFSRLMCDPQIVVMQGRDWRQPKP